MYTTASIEVAGRSELNRSHRTVPLTADLVRFFRRAKDAGVDYVVLEVTSQALHQFKLDGTPVEVAVMTNLTQDHLDYHKTMEAYAEAKARLFTDLKPQSSLLNRDDAWYPFFARRAKGLVRTYGQDPEASLCITNLKQAPTGSDWMAGALKLHTHLPGLFNVYNATAAAGVGTLLQIDEQAIIRGVQALEAVPGRMQRVDAGRNFAVYVDYAHAPDAIDKALQAAKSVATGKVHIVFGATGDRDKAKRPLMGEIAAKRADFIYLTDDETYTENGDVIRQAVMDGIKAAGGAEKTVEIADRRKAIEAALKAAKKGDAVLLAGIGHQDYRNMGGKAQPWVEADVVRQILRKL